MTIEEKANAYDEAIERARSIYDQTAVPTPPTMEGVCEYIFPELEESEDERISKQLVEFLDNIWHLGKNGNFDKYDKTDCANWIAWVNKQKKLVDIYEDKLDRCTCDNFAKGYEAGTKNMKWRIVDKPIYVDGPVLAQRKNRRNDPFNGYVCCQDHTLTPDVYDRYLKLDNDKSVDKCAGCNNVKGCITCTDGDQWCHITEQKD